MHSFPFSTEAVLFRYQSFELRICTTAEEIRAVQAFRYRCYLPTGMIDPRPDELFGDTYDFQRNTTVFAVYQNGQIVGSIRNQIFSSDYGWEPTYMAENKSQYVNCGYGKSAFFETSRFCAAALDSRSKRIIVGILFRAQAIAQQVAEVDWLFIQAQPRHARFYERFMGYSVLGHSVPDICGPTTLMRAPHPVSCSFPYSDWQFLELDEKEVFARYELIQQSSPGHYLSQVA